jgi:anti-anti-sigma factor
MQHGWGPIARVPGESELGDASKNAIKAEGFTAQLENRGSAVVVSMRGNADMAVHEKLKVFLDDLHTTVMATRAKEAVFDFEELYFMNSSCLSLLLRFINAVVAAPTSQHYLVKFKSNPKLRWQQKSLDALRAYAQDHVFVE